VVPESYHDFFLAVAGASGALVGLLFVAVSLAPEGSVGSDATHVQQIRASTALTALLSPLVLSLIGLIPDTNVGWAALVIGVLGVLFVAATLRRLASRDREDRSRRTSMAVLTGFLVVMLLELVAGIRLLNTPHSDGPIGAIAGAVVASLTIGVNRSWELVGARGAGITSSIRTIVMGERDGPGES